MTRASLDDESKAATTDSDQRISERRTITLPARLAWKDQRGVGRFASVVTRDVSAVGVFVECETALSLPLYRLVQFQFEPNVRVTSEFPEPLRHGRILSAVYRVSPAQGQERHGIALRLMVEPHRLVSHPLRAPASANT